MTYTWSPDSGGDTPPDSVWVWENASATGGSDTAGATESADDGLGDTAVVSGNSLVSSCTQGHLAKISVSTGQFSRSITVSASSSISNRASTALISATVSDSLLIHAQPYGWYQTSVTVNSPNPGELTFGYAWKSTTGMLSDLSILTTPIQEVVTYPGGNPFYPDSPPIGSGYSYPNPTRSLSIDPATGSAGDIHARPTFQTPYSSTSYTGTQNYVFNDSVTGETDVVLMGPNSIVRAVDTRPGYAGYWYSCSKSGYTAWYQLP